MTVASITKKTAYYFLYQIDKIGQLTTELLALRSLFDNIYNLHVVTLDPYKIRGVNHSVYEMLTRGLSISYTEDVESLLFSHRLRGFEQTIGIRDFNDYVIITLAPEKLVELCIKKFGRHGWNYICNLNEYDIQKGKALKEALEMPDDAKIVTLHVREPGYLNDEGHFSDYRNANIYNYLPAIEFLISKGYYIVRIGDKTMKPLPIKHFKILDAPFHPFYADFFEPYFVSQSTFYLGMPSGPASLAFVFDIHLLLTNRIYHWGENGYYKGLSIYKHYWSRQLKRYLTYQEIMTSPTLNYYDPAQYSISNIELHENTGEEILRGVMEMESRINNAYAIDSNFNAKIDNVFNASMKYNMQNVPEIGTGWNMQDLEYMQISHEVIKLNNYLLSNSPLGIHQYVNSGIDMKWRKLLRQQHTVIDKI